jgi:hypothetical protein
MAKAPLTGKHANHIVARVCGVNPTDTKVEAAEKAIAVMRSVGMCTKSAESLLAAYKKKMRLD